MEDERVVRIAREVVREMYPEVEDPEKLISSVKLIEITVDYSGLYERTEKKEKEVEKEGTEEVVASSLKLASGTPKWPLHIVKSILQAKTRTVMKPVGRKDGKDDWRNIFLTTDQAKEVILSLTLEDFQKTLYNFTPPVDWYEKDYDLPLDASDLAREAKGNSTYLYIKIFIENNSMIITESFHWGDPINGRKQNRP